MFADWPTFARESVPGTLDRNPSWGGHRTALLTIIDFLEPKEILEPQDAELDQVVNPLQLTVNFYNFACQ